MLQLILLAHIVILLCAYLRPSHSNRFTTTTTTTTALVTLSTNSIGLLSPDEYIQLYVTDALTPYFADVTASVSGAGFSKF